jgi:hypothetical protein
MCKFLVSHCTYNLYFSIFWNSITNCDVFTNITQSYQKNRNKTGNITQTKITGIFTTLDIIQVSRQDFIA